MKYSLKQYHFGTMLNGALDYRVYETSSYIVEGIGKTYQELQIQAAAEGCDKISKNRVCHELYWSIPDELQSAANVAYSNMTAKTGTPESIDLITIEFDEWIFVRYCRLGQWYAFAEKKNFNMSNQVLYGNKHNYYAIYDGDKWCDPDSY